MRTNRRTLATTAVALATLATLAACGDGEATDPETEAPSTDASEAPTEGSDGTPAPGEPLPTAGPGTPSDGPETPSDGTETPSGGTSPSDLLPDQAAAVDRAVTDLSEEQGVEPDAVEVVTFEEVTWSDGSIGCPQPDMAYTQALVEGTRLVLAIDGEELHYHGADDGYLSYCADPIEPASTGDAVQ
ncbi:MAG: hypothetical protein ACTHXO_01515 [Actinomycetaceae bacterium]